MNAPKPTTHKLSRSCLMKNLKWPRHFGLFTDPPERAPENINAQATVAGAPNLSVVAHTL
jgi:hypothetical protein